MTKSIKNPKTKHIDQPKWGSILGNLTFGLVFTLGGLLFLSRR